MTASERGEDVETAGVGSLSADECGKGAPNGFVGRVNEDEGGRLEHVGFVDLVFGHDVQWFFVWGSEREITKIKVRKTEPEMWKTKLKCENPSRTHENQTPKCIECCQRDPIRIRNLENRPEDRGNESGGMENG